MVAVHAVVHDTEMEIYELSSLAHARRHYY